MRAPPRINSREKGFRHRKKPRVPAKFRINYPDSSEEIIYYPRTRPSNLHPHKIYNALRPPPVRKSLFSGVRGESIPTQAENLHYANFFQINSTSNKEKKGPPIVSYSVWHVEPPFPRGRDEFDPPPPLFIMPERKKNKMSDENSHSTEASLESNNNSSEEHLSSSGTSTENSEVFSTFSEADISIEKINSVEINKAVNNVVDAESLLETTTALLGSDEVPKKSNELTPLVSSEDSKFSPFTTEAPAFTKSSSYEDNSAIADYESFLELNLSEKAIPAVKDSFTKTPYFMRFTENSDSEELDYDNTKTILDHKQDKRINAFRQEVLNEKTPAKGNTILKNAKNNAVENNFISIPNFKYNYSKNNFPNRISNQLLNANRAVGFSNNYEKPILTGIFVRPIYLTGSEEWISNEWLDSDSDESQSHYFGSNNPLFHQVHLRKRRQNPETRSISIKNDKSAEIVIGVISPDDPPRPYKPPQSNPIIFQNSDGFYPISKPVPYVNPKESKHLESYLHSPEIITLPRLRAGSNDNSFLVDGFYNIKPSSDEKSSLEQKYTIAYAESRDQPFAEERKRRGIFRPVVNMFKKVEKCMRLWC